MPHVFVAHISFWRSRPSCHTTTLQTKHTQIQDTLVANSHACFKEPALKTLKPILRKHLQEYKIYKASKALFFKPLKHCLLKRGDYALPHAGVSHGSFLDHTLHIIRQRFKPNTLKFKILGLPIHMRVLKKHLSKPSSPFCDSTHRNIKSIEQHLYTSIKVQAGTIHHTLYLQ